MIHVNFLSRVFYLELEIKGLDTCFVRDLNSSKTIQSGFLPLLIMICTLNLLENAMTVQNSDKYLGKCVWKVESLIITKDNHCLLNVPKHRITKRILKSFFYLLLLLDTIYI